MALLRQLPGAYDDGLLFMSGDDLRIIRLCKIDQNLARLAFDKSGNGDTANQSTLRTTKADNRALQLEIIDRTGFPEQPAGFFDKRDGVALQPDPVRRLCRNRLGDQAIATSIPSSMLTWEILTIASHRLALTPH